MTMLNGRAMRVEVSHLDNGELFRVLSPDGSTYRAAFFTDEAPPESRFHIGRLTAFLRSCAVEDR